MNFSTTPGFKLAKLTKLKRQFLDDHLSQFGLSRTQWQVMIWLDILDKPSAQQDVLKNMELDAAHLARVLEQLEKRGFLQRYHAENNRRSLFILVTDEGKKMIELIREVVKKETKTIFKGFTLREKTQFIEQLDKIELNVLSALEHIRLE